MTDAEKESYKQGLLRAADIAENFGKCTHELCSTSEAVFEESFSEEIAKAIRKEANE